MCHMHIVYLITHDKTGEIYIGYTTNLKERIKAHNSGLNKSTARVKGKWILVYAEAFLSKKDAQLRERRLKQHGRAVQELKKRIQHSLLQVSSGAG